MTSNEHSKSITIINDVRAAGDFSKTSFSGYKKCAVLKEVVSEISRSNIETSCFWTAECIASGYYLDLWNIIINYSCEYLHIANPRLILLVNKLLKQFKEIANKTNNDLQLRNDPNIRKMFFDTVVIICKSNRKTKFQYVKIQDKEVDLNIMSSKFSAPSTNYIDKIFNQGDPKELYMSLNEFCFNLSKDNENFNQACYWYEWMVHFDEMCRKRKGKIECLLRDFIPDRLGKNAIDGLWLIWHALFDIAKDKGKGINSMIENLFELFTFKYTTKSWSHKRYIIYYAISLVVDKVDFSIPLVKDSKSVDNITKQLDLMFIEIKKNEIYVKPKSKLDHKLDVYSML